MSFWTAVLNTGYPATAACNMHRLGRLTGVNFLVDLAVCGPSGVLYPRGDGA